MSNLYLKIHSTVLLTGILILEKRKENSEDWITDRRYFMQINLCSKPLIPNSQSLTSKQMAIILPKIQNMIGL